MARKHVALSSSSTGQQTDVQNIVFTDGEYINQIAACKDVSRLLITVVVIFGIIRTIVLFSILKSSHRYCVFYYRKSSLFLFIVQNGSV